MNQLEQHWDKAQPYFVGSGGGGKGKGSGEAPDTLRSKAILTVLFAVGEGQVQGYSTISELEKNVYLNDTPIRNADESLNFKSAKVFFTNGTQDQEELPGFSDKIESDVDVNQVVRKDQGPVTRYISDTAADLLRITVVIPGLVEQKGKKIEGSKVEFTVKITDSTGAVITDNDDGLPGAYHWIIQGKTTSQYEEDRIFKLSGNSPYKVVLTRVTKDSEKSTIRNDLSWERYTLINLDRLRHPNTAMLGVQVSSRELSGIPKIGIRGKWIKCRLPHNYDPIARTYTGIFNGSFSNFGWTNNPAYILRQLMTSTRYGVGNEIAEALQNNFNLYEIGKFCDEIVDDGFGGTEPRFTLNGIIAESDDADKILDSLVAHFRVMTFFSGGQLHYVQDKEQDFVRIYTEANTVQETDADGRVTKPCFNYEGVGRKARHTAATVKFKNKDNFHRDDVEYVADEAAIARYGYNLLEIDSPYTDSIGQAHREGLYKILTEKYETETINFSVEAEGYLCVPGEIFATADPYKQQGRYGGRIVAISDNLREVTLDADVILKPGRNYSLSCVHGARIINCDLSAVNASEHVVAGTGFNATLLGAKVGDSIVTQVINSTTLTLSANPGLGSGTSVDVTFLLPNYQMTRTVTTPSGTVRTLTVASPFPAQPPANSTWVLSDNVQPLLQWRCLSVTPKDNGIWDIVGVAYKSEKFAELEEDKVKRPRKAPKIPEPPAIDKLRVVEGDSGNFTISWKPKKIVGDGGASIENPNITGYVVQYRRNDDNLITSAPVADTSYTVHNAAEGIYDVQVGIKDNQGIVRWSDGTSKGSISSTSFSSAEFDSYTIIDMN